MAIFNEEREYLLENLSLLVSSGMGVAPALEAIGQDVRTSQAKKLIRNILDDVEAGFSLWTALERTRAFPKRVVSLIRVGEKSGRLMENLVAVVSQQQKERLFRSKIFSAVFYPAIVFLVTIVVGVGVAWFLLPRLARVFESLNVELPLLTKIFLGIGEFLSNWGILAILVLGGGFLFLSFLIFRAWGDRLLLSIPGIKQLIKEIELARFGFVLGSLLEAGLPVNDALDSLEESSSSRVYRKFYSYLGQSVKDGNSFKKSFVFYPGIKQLFPAPIRHTVSAAEQSGRLSETLLHIGNSYEARVDDTAKNLTVALEPILLVVVWLGVVLVALAVILPIYSLIGGFNP